MKHCKLTAVCFLLPNSVLNVKKRQLSVSEVHMRRVEGKRVTKAT